MDSIEIQLAKLQTQFEEHRKQTEESLESISHDVKTLVADKNQRVGAARVNKTVLAIALVAIPAAVSAATTYFFHK